MNTGAYVPPRPDTIASHSPASPPAFLQNPLASTMAARRWGASAGEKRTALMLSVGLTMAMFGVLLLASISTMITAPVQQVLVAFDARAAEAEPVQQSDVIRPEPEPVAAPIQVPGEPGSQPAPLPAAAPPSQVRLPVAAIDLTPRTLPIETLAVPLAAVPIDEAGGVAQVIGSGEGGGGSGTGAGRGAGGSGSGSGGGRKLFVSWAPSMDFSRDNRYFPPAARAARVEGVAWLRCLVIRNDRVRDCTLVGEEPQGYGFGEAALKTVPGLRLRLHDERGRRVYDDWAVVTSTFTLDNLPEMRQARREAETPEPAPLP